MMENTLATLSKAIPRKAFWEKPEGKFAKWVVVPLLIIAGGTLLYKALPYIITLLENTLYAIFLIAVLAVIFILAFSKKVQLAIEYYFQAIIRLVLGLIVTLDPIGILEGNKGKFKRRQKILRDNKGKLRGLLRDLLERINQARGERTKSLQLAKQALSRAQAGDSRYMLTFEAKSRKAARRKSRILSFQEMYQRLEVLFRALEKIDRVVDFYIEDIEDQVEDLKIRYRSTNAAYYAFMAAKGVLMAEGEDGLMVELAIERLNADYSMKIGQIEDFVYMATDMINTFDLETMSINAEALDEFERWERQADTLVLGEEKVRLIREAADPSDILDIDRSSPSINPPPPDRPSNKYKEMFFPN
ncbi:MAG: hypothetical protein ABIH52_03355 [Candidatus Aenigmatarchaeota archaeon]